jgi:hypothetical protein
MADYINNVAAGDAYTDDCTLGPDFTTNAAVITVANNAVLMQFAIGKVGDWRWTDEREFFSIPQSFRVADIIGVKFRNANPGQTARILAVLSGVGDPDFQSGIPFTGTLSASGAISGGSGAMQLIQDQLLQVNAATIDFSNIPATFTHLRLIAYLRCTAAALETTAGVLVNGDAAAANYLQERIDASVAALSSTADSGIQPFGFFGVPPAATAVAGRFAPADLLIPHYAQALNRKVALFRSFSFASGGRIREGGWEWANTSIINRLTIIDATGGGGFAAGSRVSLYGIT